MYTDKNLETAHRDSKVKKGEALNDKIQNDPRGGYGNRADFSSLEVRQHYNSDMPTLVQASAPEYRVLPSENKVIQRQLVINPINPPANVILTPQENNKIALIQNILQQFGLNALQVGIQAGQNWQVQINIIPQRSSNLATTLIDHANNLITIDMCRFLLTNFDVPFIVGLLGHELGAHHLSDLEMTPNQQFVENGNNNTNFNIVAGAVAGAGQYTMTPVPGGHNAGRQQDHINAAKFNAVIANSSPRAILYMNTMVKIGNAMIAHNGNAIAGIEAALRVLLSTYLFDIARIIVDNDRNSSIRIYLNANHIAAVMNWLQGLIAAATNPGAVPPAANIPLPNIQPPALVPNAAIQQADLNWINNPLINIPETAASIRQMLRSALSKFLF